MPERSFLVVTQYAMPDYRLGATDGAQIAFAHSSGVRVLLGDAPSGGSACLAESDQFDDDMLGLLKGDVEQDLDESSISRLWAFSRDVRERHRAAAEHVVRLVRWLARRDEGGPPIGVRQSARWSIDGTDWHRLRVGDPPDTDVGWGEFDFDAGWRQAAARLLEVGETEPLGHELLQEAAALIDTNPRSCIVLAVAALEVALKRQIIRLGGKVTEAARSPDILGLLNQALPQMRPNRWKTTPSWLNARLGAGVAARNRTVHTGDPPPPRSELMDLIRAVRDVLYLMDWQYGHDWAESFVSFPLGDTNVTGPKPVFRGRMRLV